MTQNQIAYWSLVETKRSNQAREYETARHNRAQEQISWANISELARHNRKTEFQSSQVLEEQIRHNMIDEQLRQEGNMMKINSWEAALGYIFQPALTGGKEIVNTVVTAVGGNSSSQTNGRPTLKGNTVNQSVSSWLIDTVNAVTATELDRDGVVTTGNFMIP